MLPTDPIFSPLGKTGISQGDAVHVLLVLWNALETYYPELLCTN